MSIPKSESPLPDPKRGHYFDPAPEAASKPRTLHLHLKDLDVELQADRGVFGSRAIDLGTLVLLKEAPPPPAQGDILDLGSGYGPIAIALALRSPAARIWAVDVNERALELVRANAEAAKTPNVVAAFPDGAGGPGFCGGSLQPARQGGREPSARPAPTLAAARRRPGPFTWSCSAAQVSDSGDVAGRRVPASNGSSRRRDTGSLGAPPPSPPLRWEGVRQ
jgi:SAM-dependent methyltransferase